MPGLAKVDVDAAFRRLPLLPAHRWAAAVAFMFAGTVCGVGLFGMHLIAGPRSF